METTELTPKESQLLRQCKSCSDVSSPIHRQNENSFLPWKESGITYQCKNCHQEIWIANTCNLL